MKLMLENLSVLWEVFLFYYEKELTRYHDILTVIITTKLDYLSIAKTLFCVKNIFLIIAFFA